ncbi:hypothetical protein ANN_24205 [Periplaneta americana]|uniref:Retrotransposon gag domain-containing protein n=1 Tax=Periplaneta americana TaxID=6978 RepID=A0ABQ8S358_PERAM|nr:hypothetical protein ANN_24205 [Periplaneta americana]
MAILQLICRPFKTFKTPALKTYRYEHSQGLEVIFEVDIRLVIRYVPPEFDYPILEIERTDYLPQYCQSDLSVTKLVEPWKGDSYSIPVTSFFDQIERITTMGRLTDKDAVQIAILKLRGTARTYYDTTPELQAVDISFKDFKENFIARFKDKRSMQYHYLKLQNAMQEKHESPEEFCDRVRRLSLKTIVHDQDANTREILKQEADRRLVAAFIHGLRGTVGREVRFQAPTTIDNALRIANQVYQTEKDEGASVLKEQKDKKLFMVQAQAGNRQQNSGNYQAWSNNRRYEPNFNRGFARGRDVRPGEIILGTV